MDFFHIQIVAHTTKSTGSELMRMRHVLSLSQLATCALLFLGYVSSFAIVLLRADKATNHLLCLLAFRHVRSRTAAHYLVSHAVAH